MSTIIATCAIGYLELTPYFWPVVILMTFCIPTIICAIYAVMPNAFSAGTLGTRGKL